MDQTAPRKGLILHETVEIDISLLWRSVVFFQLLHYFIPVCMGLSRGRRGQLGHLLDRTGPYSPVVWTGRCRFTFCQHLSRTKTPSSFQINDLPLSIHKKYKKKSVTSIQRHIEPDGLNYTITFYFRSCHTCFTQKDQNTLSPKSVPTPENGPTVSQPRVWRVNTVPAIGIWQVNFPRNDVTLPLKSNRTRECTGAFW